MRVAIIHAGLEKTGSTALQSWLAANRHALLGAGVLIPRSVGEPNHTRLVAACLDDGVTDNIKAHLMAREGLGEAALRGRVRAALNTELRETTGWRQLVITSELISSRLHSPTEVARLVDWLSPHVDHVHFVLVLRRQDDLAVSRYSSALRAGHAGFDDIWADLSAQSFLSLPASRNADDMREYFDYRRILARYEAVPDARLTVLPYAPPEGPLDVTGAFRDLLGLGHQTGSAVPARANPALSAAAQYIISQLNRENRVLWPSGARNEPYRALLRRIETEQQGSRRLVPRVEAMAFLARFGESNADVTARHRPAGMFREGFDHWPVAVDHAPMIAALAPVLARYRADAAALPRTEAARPVLGRVWSGLRQRMTGR